MAGLSFGYSSDWKQGLISERENVSFLGSDLKYFEGSKFWCKDGSKQIPKERLNDNFCDCEDGTDEPGKILNHVLIFPICRVLLFGKNMIVKLPD